MLSKSSSFVCVLPIIAAFALFSSVDGDEEVLPDLKEIVSAGERTNARLYQEAATWKSVFELPGRTVRAEVEVLRGPDAKRLRIGLAQGTDQQEIALIIHKEGVWYISDDTGNHVYRPFEAPFLVPALYSFVARANVHTLQEYDLTRGELLGVEENVAVFHRELPPSTKAALQKSLELLLSTPPGEPGGRQSKRNSIIANLRASLEEKIEVRVNVATGVVEQNGLSGNRVWCRDFRFVDEFKQSELDTSNFRWIDRTKCLLDTCKSRDDLILIGDARMWRPGTPGSDTDIHLLNINSGEMRRLPYKWGIGTSGCFSRNREKVYIAGTLLDRGSIGITEIDLDSQEHRLLGGPNLQDGFTMFPVLSPDGKLLSVVRRTASTRLDSEIHVIDIATGTSNQIGGQIDASTAQWLPDQTGFIVDRRELDAALNRRKSTICLVDWDGRVSPIIEGEIPRVLPRQSRILFRDSKEGEWRTCDLKGEDSKIVGDGLTEFGFPTVSPSATQLIMMKFGHQKGPRPCLVDIETGESTPITVGDGLWALPAWR